MPASGCPAQARKDGSVAARRPRLMAFLQIVLASAKPGPTQRDRPATKQRCHPWQPLRRLQGHRRSPAPTGSTANGGADQSTALVVGRNAGVIRIAARGTKKTSDLVADIELTSIDHASNLEHLTHLPKSLFLNIRPEFGSVKFSPNGGRRRAGTAQCPFCLGKQIDAAASSHAWRRTIRATKKGAAIRATPFIVFDCFNRREGKPSRHCSDLCTASSIDGKPMSFSVS